MSRCLRCGRPIPEGQSFCRRWWAGLSPKERSSARTWPGLLQVVACQALARLQERAHAPAVLPMVRGKTVRTLIEGREPATEGWNRQAVKLG